MAPILEKAVDFVCLNTPRASPVIKFALAPIAGVLQIPTSIRRIKRREDILSRTNRGEINMNIPKTLAVAGLYILEFLGGYKLINNVDPMALTNFLAYTNSASGIYEAIRR